MEAHIWSYSNSNRLLLVNHNPLSEQAQYLSNRRRNIAAKKRGRRK